MSSNIISCVSIFPLIYSFVFLSSVEILADRLHAFIRQYHCTNTLGILCIMGLSDTEGPPDTNITLVARISQKQTARYSRTNVMWNTKLTQQGSKHQRWQLSRCTWAR
jgi:hypothetical protein